MTQAATKAINEIGSAPAWLESDLSALPLTFTAKVVAVKLLAGTGTITCTDGTGATGKVLTLPTVGDREDVEIKAVTAKSGPTSVRFYFARSNS